MRTLLAILELGWIFVVEIFKGGRQK